MKSSPFSEHKCIQFCLNFHKSCFPFCVEFTFHYYNQSIFKTTVYNYIFKKHFQTSIHSATSLFYITLIMNDFILKRRTLFLSIYLRDPASRIFKLFFPIYAVILLEIPKTALHLQDLFFKYFSIFYSKFGRTFFKIRSLDEETICKLNTLQMHFTLVQL